MRCREAHPKRGGDFVRVWRNESLNRGSLIFAISAEAFGLRAFCCESVRTIQRMTDGHEGMSCIALEKQRHERPDKRTVKALGAVLPRGEQERESRAGTANCNQLISSDYSKSQD